MQRTSPQLIWNARMRPQHKTGQTRPSDCCDLLVGCPRIYHWLEWYLHLACKPWPAEAAYQCWMSSLSSTETNQTQTPSLTHSYYNCVEQWVVGHNTHLKSSSCDEATSEVFWSTKSRQCNMPSILSCLHYGIGWWLLPDARCPRLPYLLCDTPCQGEIKQQSWNTAKTVLGRHTSEIHTPIVKHNHYTEKNRTRQDP